MCSRALPWYLWLDGRMDDHMTTCTQRATSHKCSILFSNNTLRPVPSHSGLLGSGLWPTLAFLSLLQSNFGACRGHQGWDQFTLSSVLQINSCTHSLLGLYRQEIINILLVKTKKRKTISIFWKYQNHLNKKELIEILNRLTWKWTDPLPGEASMRMTLAGWSELKMCFVLKKVYCIFKNNNN